jgi:WD40 repeat protein
MSDVEQIPESGSLPLNSHDNGSIDELTNKFPNTPSQIPSAPDHLDPIRGSIVSIHSQKGTLAGTGFFISKTLVVTCAHVAENAGAKKTGRLCLRLYNEQTVSASVIEKYWRVRKQEDIAILEVQDDLQIEPLKLMNEYNTFNHEFETYGFPENFPGSLYGYGKIKTSIVKNNGLTLIQLDSEGSISNGFSGAPVFNLRTQRVVGVITERTKVELEERKINGEKVFFPTGRFEATAFATPSSVLLKICPSLQIDLVCPYKELSAFSDNDARFFYGRDLLIKKLIGKLQTYPNFLAVLGASGSGKSSVVQAGLIPKIRSGEVSGFQKDTPIVHYRFADFTDNEIIEDYSSNEFQNVKNASRNYIKNHADRVVIFIDQFEQLFGKFSKRPNDLQLFLQKIADYLSENQQVTLILTLRTEFHPQLEISPLGKWVTDRTCLVPAVASDDLDLSAVITEPAKQVGLELDKGLCELIIQQLGNTNNPLPMLEFTLTRVWQLDKAKNQLTLETYKKIGGVTGALPKWANQFYYSYSSDEQKELILRILARLIWFNPNDYPDTRRRVSRKALEYLGSEASIIIDKMTEERLLAIDDNTIEITHDTLIDRWLKQEVSLSKWLKRQRQFYFWFQRFEEDFEKWKLQNQERNLLLSDPYLAESEAYLKNYSKDFNDEQIKYIDLSRKRRNRGRNLIILVLAAGLLVASGFYLFAEEQRKIAKSIQLATASEANLQEDATRSLLLAGQAVSVKETTQANIALWNAFQANHERINIHPHRAGKVISAKYVPNNAGQVLTLGTEGAAYLWDLSNPSQPRAKLLGHKDAITSGNFSPHNPNLILTTSNDGTARIWNLENPTNSDSLLLHRNQEVINQGFFDPHDANRIVTLGSNGSVNLWNINQPAKATTLLGHKGDIRHGVFDTKIPDRLLTVGNDGIAKVWSLKDPAKSTLLQGHKGAILYGAFDPGNPNRVLTVGVDRTLRVWDVRVPSQSQVFAGHDDSVLMLEIDSSRRNRVLTVSDDGTARIWHIDKTGDAAILLKSNGSPLSFGAFNPRNPNQVVTAGKDGSISFWDISDENNPKVVSSLVGHSSSISEVAFNPTNSNQVLTASNDGTARIWDILNPPYLELNSVRTNLRNNDLILAIVPDLDFKNKFHVVKKNNEKETWSFKQLDQLGSMRTEYTVSSARKISHNIQRILISPSAPNIVITTDGAGKIYLHDFHKDTDSPIQLPLEKQIDNIIFSPKDPHKVLLISEGSALAWSTSKNRLPITISAVSGVISTGTFLSNDSNLILLGDSKGYISLWDLRKPQNYIWKEKVSNEEIWHISLDPKNPDRVLVVGSDRIAHIWRLGKKQEEQQLTTHNDVLIHGEIDPNHPNRILTIGEKGRVYVHNLDSRTYPLVLDIQDKKVESAFFDPHNANRIVVLDKSGIARLFSISGKELLERADSQSSRCLTDEEASQYEVSEKKWFHNTFRDCH